MPMQYLNSNTDTKPKGVFGCYTTRYNQVIHLPEPAIISFPSGGWISKKKVRLI